MISKDPQPRTLDRKSRNFASDEIEKSLGSRRYWRHKHFPRDSLYQNRSRTAKIKYKQNNFDFNEEFTRNEEIKFTNPFDLRERKTPVSGASLIRLIVTLGVVFKGTVRRNRPRRGPDDRPCALLVIRFAVSLVQNPETGANFHFKARTWLRSIPTVVEKGGFRGRVIARCPSGRVTVKIGFFSFPDPWRMARSLPRNLIFSLVEIKSYIGILIRKFIGICIFNYNSF